MNQSRGFDISIPLLTEVLTNSAQPEETLETLEAVEVPEAVAALDAADAMAVAEAVAPFEAAVHVDAPDQANAPVHVDAPDQANAPVEADAAAGNAVSVLALPPQADPAPVLAPVPGPDPVRERDAQQWAAIERKVTERILTQLQGRIDRVLEQHVRDCLADVLQLALVNLTEEIRSGLQHNLEKIVAQAVGLELAAIKSAGE